MYLLMDVVRLHAKIYGTKQVEDPAKKCIPYMAKNEKQYDTKDLFGRMWKEKSDTRSKVLSM
jgi:hypothetical protein